MADLNNLQDLYNKQFETLQQRLSKIDKQKSGMRDFYTKAEPMVNNQIVGNRAYGSFSTPGYKDVITDSLANTRALTDLNSEYASTEDTQINMLEKLANYIQSQEDAKKQDEKDVLENAKWELENSAVYDPTTKKYTKTNSQGDLDELLKRREALEKAGRSTSTIDQQLDAMGYKQGENLTPEQQAERQEIVDVIDRILNGSTRSATGLLRQKLFGGARNKRADIKNLNAKLQLENIDKLKGQGTITDAERQILNQAVSALDIDKETGATKITDKRFREELEKIKKKFGGVNQEEQITPEQEELINQALQGQLP